MTTILVAWIGRTDIDASNGVERAGLGPIAQAVTNRSFDKVVLISNYSKEENSSYISWLQAKTKAEIEHYYESLTSPTNYEEIYHADVKVVKDVLKHNGSATNLVFHISPGTPAMQAIWIILAKTRFNAELIESSKELGVRTPYIPFEIAAEFVPKLLHKSDKELEKLTSGKAPDTASFANIIHQSENMKRLVTMAQRVALSSFSVLIEGESGTGKELFAKAIHQASPRRNRKFIPVNCGAIPENLIESELFGHIKGAFTGAVSNRAGHFEQADGGTIFLDEIGEMPLAAQVKLLRILQEGEILRVGDSKPKQVNVRVIAATNRNLSQEITEGNFREDLYFRLATIVLHIPPLRERAGDISLLIDKLFEQEVKQKTSSELGFDKKHLSAGAKNLLLQYTWPGNVRELVNILAKAAFWSNGDKIDIDDVRYALSQSLVRKNDDVLNRPLGNGFDLEKLLATVANHYLSRAMEESNNNKSKATKLVGLVNYQTFDSWKKKYEELTGVFIGYGSDRASEKRYPFGE